MREEDGIRYYEEGEKVMTFTRWSDELTSSVNAIGYIIDSYESLFSIMVEAVTEKDNEKLEDLVTSYDETRRAILCGVYASEDCLLL